MIARKITGIAQLEKMLAEQKKIVSRDVAPFPNDTPEKKARRINRARKDRFYFYKTYLPHYFDLKPNWHHREMDAHAAKRKGTITLVIGARETGKTVQNAVGYPLHQALFERRNYIVYVAHTEDLAIDRLIAVKAELESNPRILHDFGSMKNPGLWEMDDFTLRNGVRFKPFGYKGHVRGLLNGPHRPDLIVIEDFENKQTARNIKISNEKKEFVLEELYPVMNSNGNVIWLSNLPGKKCAAALFKNETEQSPDFAGKRFILFYPLEIDAETDMDEARRARFKNGLLWPSVKTRAVCDNLRKAVGTVAYEREYKLNPVSEGRVFREEWFKQYAARPDVARSVIYTDPSTGKSKSACKKAVIMLGWTGTHYVVLDAWIRNASISAMIDAQYAMWQRWRDQPVGLRNTYVENNFAQLDELKRDYDDAARRKGWRFPVLPHVNTIDKNLRIESCSGLIERGDILFDLTDPDQIELRDQFVFYPDHPDKDGPDALRSAIDILDAEGTEFTIMSVVKRTFKRKRLH